MKVFALLLSLSIAFMAGAAPPALTKTFVDQKRGITFKYPSGFEPGRYKGDNFMPGGWAAVATLVETKELKGVPADAIPQGSIPTIDLIETTGLGARSQIAATQQGEAAKYKTTFGKVTGYKLPGAFGPYGDQALFYLVPLAYDRAIMVIAHRYYFNDPAHTAQKPVNTNYDEVIDALLATLVAKK